MYFFYVFMHFFSFGTFVKMKFFCFRSIFFFFKYISFVFNDFCLCTSFINENCADKAKQAVYFLCIRFCALQDGADTVCLLSSLLIFV